MSDDNDGKWLSKRELADLRGISQASAYRLIKRRGWRRQPGNDPRGTIRVLVPWGFLNDQSDGQKDREDKRIPRLSPGPTDKPPDKPADDHLTIAALSEAIEGWKGRALAAEAHVDREAGRADKAEIELMQLRTEIEQLRRPLLRRIMARLRRRP